MKNHNEKSIIMKLKQNQTNLATVKKRTRDIVVAIFYISEEFNERSFWNLKDFKEVRLFEYS